MPNRGNPSTAAVWVPADFFLVCTNQPSSRVFGNNYWDTNRASTIYLLRHSIRCPLGEIQLRVPSPWDKSPTAMFYNVECRESDQYLLILFQPERRSLRRGSKEEIKRAISPRTDKTLFRLILLLIFCMSLSCCFAFIYS